MFPSNYKATKLLVLIMILALFTLYVRGDLNHSLSLSQASLWHETHPALSYFIFVAFYLFIACFSLPGTGPLTFAAGAIFGIWQGILLVSLISAVGATFGMLLSRWLLRRWVEARFQQAILHVQQGLEREGKLFLFCLRLIPPLPYFVVNLVFGLTHMPVRTFFWVSQLGMLPLIVIYVNAGANLGEIDELSWSAVLSGKVLWSLALLILVPIVLKYSIRKYQRVSQRTAKSRSRSKHEPG